MAARRTRQIRLKSRDEIERMRRAGRLVHDILKRMAEMAAPGVTTGQLDAEAERMIRDAGAVGLFKDYPNHHPSGPAFPGYICASVNEEVVHGVPGERALVDGDIITVDCGVRLDDWCGDSATTIAIGEIAPEDRRLMDVTRGALELAIEHIRPDVFWSDVARRIQAHVQDAGFAVVTNYVGHGIGQEMHEGPSVPNFWSRSWASDDFRLVEGLVLAVEPMVNAGSEQTRELEDRWTVVTCDGRNSAQFEHTVAVTADGADVLTNGN